MAARHDGPRQRLLLYGDLVDDMVPCIRDLYRQSKSSVLLSSYLRQCSDILQVEVANLKPINREIIPSFHSILDLAEKYATTDGSSPFVSSFLCYIARLGELFM